MKVDGLTIFSKIGRALNNMCRLVNIFGKMNPVVDPSFSYVFICVQFQR